MKPRARKILFLIGLVSLVFILHRLGIGRGLDLAYLKEKKDRLIQLYHLHPFRTYLLFCTFYVFVTTLSVPGIIVLALAAGTLFGFWTGLVAVSFSGTLGAVFVFLYSRYLFRESLERRFRTQLVKINQGLEKEGRTYLFTLRLVPLFPFFLINLVMGLTQMSLREYAAITWAGMLPGIAVVVNAGTQLHKIHSLQDVLSPELIGSFLLLACLPWLISKLASKFRRLDQVKISR